MKMLTTDITIKAGGWDNKAETTIAEVLQKAFTQAAPAECKTHPCEVSVLLCDDATIKDINKNWRHKDKATNVLSFPQNDDIFIQDKPFCLGDIILAFETIGKEAEAKNLDFLSHLRHMTVHGFLHLVGYEHDNDHDASRMEAMEQAILAL